MAPGRHRRSRLAGPAIMAGLGAVLATGTTWAMAAGTVRTRWLLIGWVTLTLVGLGLAGLGGITVIVRLVRGDRERRPH